MDFFVEQGSVSRMCLDHGLHSQKTHGKKLKHLIIVHTSMYWCPPERPIEYIKHAVPLSPFPHVIRRVPFNELLCYRHYMLIRNETLFASLVACRQHLISQDTFKVRESSSILYDLFVLTDACVHEKTIARQYNLRVFFLIRDSYYYYIHI